MENTRRRIQHKVKMILTLCLIYQRKKMMMMIKKRERKTKINKKKAEN